MNVPMIEMPKEKALEKLKAYRADKHKDAEEQYRQAAEGYQALAEGTPLIHLDKAIQAGGFFEETGMPKLAVARADRRRVTFRWSAFQRNGRFDTRANQTWGADPGPLNMFVDMGREHGRTRSWFNRHSGKNETTNVELSGSTLVPLVPADVRPKTGQLRDWFILWEVDEWTLRAPGDPLLLRHIGGSLYAVLAQWDLTPLEQAILEGAMRS